MKNLNRKMISSWLIEIKDAKRDLIKEIEQSNGTSKEWADKQKLNHAQLEDIQNQLLNIRRKVQA